MKFSVSLSTSLLVLAVKSLPAAPSYGDHGSGDDKGLIIETTSGTLHGFINESTPDVRQWLGVPYAEPPLGYLRFAAPVMKTPSHEPIYADTWQPSCMQQWSNGSTIYTKIIPQFLIDGSNSEDCLYINIWAPSAASVAGKKLPVYVYIPGGGFTSGGAHSWYKIPDQLIQARQDVVFVIMNYRVNVFGFPDAAGLDGKNPGLLDQCMVVELTRDNIAAFGGDPERINLWGQSAGGASVDIYSYAWYEDPIVVGFSADSGTVGIAGNPGSGGANFSYLAGLVGCGNLSDAAELSCMRNVPAGTLENTLSEYLVSDEERSISFSPVIDNELVFANYTQRAVDGNVANAPMIVGNNNNEGAGFVPFTEDGPGNAALAAADRIITCSVLPELDNRDLAGLTTYRYIYAGNFSNISPLPWMGAYHSSELPLIFGTHYEYRGNSTEFEWEAATTMQDLWLSFATDKSQAPTAQLPNGSTLVWPKYSAAEATTVEFALDDTVASLIVGVASESAACSSAAQP